MWPRCDTRNTPFVHVRPRLALYGTPTIFPRLYEFAGNPAPVVCISGALTRACTC